LPTTYLFDRATNGFYPTRFAPFRACQTSFAMSACLRSLTTRPTRQASLRRRASMACSATPSAVAPLAAALLIAASPLVELRAAAAGLPPNTEAEKVLCDATCSAGLEQRAPLETSPSGLSWRDIVVGDGVVPEIGFQVVVDYVAMTDTLRIFDNSLERGKARAMRWHGSRAITPLLSRAHSSRTTSEWCRTPQTPPSSLA